MFNVKGKSSAHIKLWLIMPSGAQLESSSVYPKTSATDQGNFYVFFGKSNLSLKTVRYSYLYTRLLLTSAFNCRCQAHAISAQSMRCCSVQVAYNPFKVALLAYAVSLHT
jgi:hypothetical protein